MTVYDGFTTALPDWSWYTNEQPWTWRTATMVHEYLHTAGYNPMDSVASQTECAARNGRTNYYANGEPSAPYIDGSCGHAVIAESWRVCGDIRESCPTGSLRLLHRREGTSSATQAAGTCECGADPSHVIALRTSIGNTVNAWAGGGRT